MVICCRSMFTGIVLGFVFVQTCLSGFIYTDQIPTSDKNCSSTEFTCTSGARSCIPMKWRCDDDQDCDDGSDEEHCASCNENQLTCGDNNCISLGWACDGEKDCVDGADENPSMCQVNETCKYFGSPCLSTTSVCVSFKQLCNGHVDCPNDSSDENKNCTELLQPTYDNICGKCKHDCTILTNGMPSCYCPDGFIIDSKDNTSCIEANNCDILKPCEQNCRSLHKGWLYECSCVEGFTKSKDDSHICIISETDPKPYLLASSQFLIQKFTLTGHNLSSTDDAINVVAMDYDLNSNEICWIQAITLPMSSTLVCGNIGDISSTHVVNLPYSVDNINQLAIDWLTNNIYFINGASGRIFACNKTQPAICVIIQQYQSTSRMLSLAVDAYAGLLFASDCGKYPRLIRMDMDGRNSTSIVKLRIVFPKAIALDINARRIYFFDGHVAYLESVDYEGQHRRTIVEAMNGHHFFAMAYFNNSLYLSDWANNSVIRVGVRSGPGALTTTIKRKLRHPSAIRVVHPLLQRQDAHHGCADLHCEQICLLGARRGHSTSGSCFCTAGYTLNSDQRTCKPPSEDQLFLLYTKENPGEIKGTLLSSQNSPTHPTMVPIENLHTPKAVDYYRDDMGEDWIIFADSTTYEISMEESFSASVHTCEGLAIDWTSRNIFWTDDDHKAVFMTRLLLPSSSSEVGKSNYPRRDQFHPSKYRTTLVKGNMSHIRSIAVHPKLGSIYWTVWEAHGEMNNKYGSIQQALMDGSKRKTLVSGPNMTWPNDIAIDYKRDILYWVEAYHDRIESIYLNGTGRRLILSGRTEMFRRYLSHPFSIAYYENDNTSVVESLAPLGQFLYWTEFRDGKIYRLNLTAALDPSTHLSRSDVQLITTDTAPLLRVTVFNPGSKTGTSKCRGAPCSDFCVPTLTSPFYKCLCPDNKEFKNDTTCIAKQNYTITISCPPGRFACDNGMCILSKWVCDRDNDCLDNSDEKPSLCHNKACQGDSFECNSTHMCISPRWVCDGESDCPDNEDEDPEICRSRICPPGKFRCQAQSGSCLPEAWLCDRESDCPNGFDENRNCSFPKCNPGLHFTCKSGDCIPVMWRCDNDDDCGDSSDEVGCKESQPHCKDPDEIPCASSGEDSSVCILRRWRCDGDKDCPNGSDEKDCPKISCSPHTKRCASGEICVFVAFLCDGHDDCVDGSDEWNCSCPHNHTTNHDQILCLTPDFVHACVNRCDGLQDCLLNEDEKNCSTWGTCANAGCSHFCAEIGQNFICSCPKGKELSDDKRTCRDIEYCVERGLCSQRCSYVGSGYMCSCYPGWHIDPLYPSGSICAYNKQNPPPFLIYATRHSLKYLNIDEHQALRGKPKLLVGELRHALVMDFDFKHQLLFYVDVLDSTIVRATVTYNAKDQSLEIANSIPIVSHGLATTEGIAVDWIAERIYFVEASLDQIEVTDFVGKYRSVIIAENMENPRAVAVDPRFGLIFWTDWATDNARVERATMAGTERAAIWTSENDHSGWLNGITLDYMAERIYWADAKYDVIWSAEYDGNDLFAAVPRATDWLLHPFGLTLYGHRLFWTDWRTTVVACSDKWSERNVSVLEIAFNKPFDVKVFHESRQPFITKTSDKNIINPCLGSPCHGLCLIVPKKMMTSELTYKCACPQMFTLSRDGVSCDPLTSFMLLSRYREIRGIRLDNLNYSANYAISAPDLYNATRLAYDAARDQIYWSDAKRQEIRRAFINGSGVETVIGTDSPSVYGLVVDWLRNKVFWTSYTEQTHSSNIVVYSYLSVATLDGREHLDWLTLRLFDAPWAFTPPVLLLRFKYRLNNITDGWKGVKVQRPRYLTADINGALLYFVSDDGIYSIHMDGSNLKKISNLINVTDLRFVPRNHLYCVSNGTLMMLHRDHCESPWCEVNFSIPATKVALHGHVAWIYVEDKASIYKLDQNTGDGKQRDWKLSLRRNDTTHVADMIVFSLADQNKSEAVSTPCADNNGGCEQICLPALSNQHTRLASCKCNVGYQPSSANSSSCEGINDFLVYATAQSVRGMHLDGDSDALVPIMDQSRPNGVDFYAKNSTIVWVDSGTTALKAATRDMTSKWTIYSPYTATTSSTIVSKEDYEGVAVDWIAKNVYWTDASLREIKVIRMDGLYPYTVYRGGDKLRAIVVHPRSGYLFVSDWGHEAGIIRMKLDGSNVIKILSDLGWPNGMTIDYENGRLYWCDARNKSIFAANLDGSDKKVVFANEQSRTYGIAFHQGILYWTDSVRNNGLISSCKVSADRCSQSSLKWLAQDMSQWLRDIVVYSPHRQLGTNLCLKNNGGCKQLCFYLGSNKRRCACSHGKLDPANNSSCLPYNHYIIFSERKVLRTINVDNPSGLNDPLPPIQNSLAMKAAIVMAADYSGDRIFYSDMSDEGIIYSFSSTYDGRSMAAPKPIIKDVGTVEGLAYHNAEDALYWTSYHDKQIFRLPLKSRQKNIPILVVPQQHEDDHLRALVLYECKRPNLIFWTNWNEHYPSVMRATTSGKNITKLITTNVMTPNGLAIDIDIKQLYWADAELDKIESCDFNGNNRKVILSQGLEHVFSIAVLGDYLYWSDWRQQEIIRVNRWSGSSPEVLRNFSYMYPMGVLAVYNNTCKPDPCLTLAQPCQRSCVVSDRGEPLCQCPNGSLASHCDRDGSQSCVSGFFNCHLDAKIFPQYKGLFCIHYDLTCDGSDDCPNGQDEDPFYCNLRPCKDGYFRCANNRCLRDDLVCNGADNCHDGFTSDEQDCHGGSRNQSCVFGMFSCDDGGCIPMAWVCDGDMDCDDESDETCDMTCLPSNFQCTSGKKCLPHTFQCDGDIDCEDGSDEVDCKTESCRSGYFTCVENGKCIEMGWVCDGESDCSDGSDEKSCGTCIGDQFQCVTSGRCINMEWKCDRDYDCDDQSDEPPDCDYPPCNGTLCPDQLHCVPQEFVCDGDSDCADGFDEANCTDDSSTCDATTHFLCSDHITCLPRSKACDGVQDCHPSGSDELNCNQKNCASRNLNSCNQICVEQRYEYTCACRRGYRLGADGHTCHDINECSEADPYPPCSQICVNKPGSYQCSCALGYYRDHKDPSNCIAGPRSGVPYIMFANKYYIGQMTLNGSKPILHTTWLRNVVALDFDWSGQKIYWTDVTDDRSVIQRMDLNTSIEFMNPTSERQTIITEVDTLHKTDLRNPYGLAVDWVARNLYWTDKGTDTIDVSKLDGRFRKTLIDSGLDKPRALALDPRSGYLYWTDWGLDPHIGRIGMGGSGRTMIIHNKLLESQTSHYWPSKKLGWPNALTIDYPSKKLFWGDAKEDYIAYCDMNGDNARILLHRPGRSAMIAHVFSLTVFEDRLYWSDWRDHSIFSVHKFRGISGNSSGPTEVRGKLLHRPMELTVVHPLRQPVPIHPHGCAIYNGGCQDLCLIEPAGVFRCACPNNFYLGANRRSCISNCTFSQFICKNDKCIPFWWKCDGVNDCGDNSDEPANCRPYFCTAGQFQCHNSTSEHHTCISPSGICDGVKKCPDGSDEINCDKHVCLPTQFKCHLSHPPRCIAGVSRCDGIPQCDNGEDEDRCPPATCLPTQFKCPLVKQTRPFCISQSKVCDGVIHCPEGTDEKNCTTSSCSFDQFRCLSNGVCISHNLVCDNEFDCEDGSDETPSLCYNTNRFEYTCDNRLCIPGLWRCKIGEGISDINDKTKCAKNKCSGTEFRCVTDQRCIDDVFRCDGEKDCPDGSDEKNCPTISCTSDQYKCTNSSACISLQYRCDGYIDCSSGADELNCWVNATAGFICPSYMYKCVSYKLCIPEAWTCDGHFDCPDGSDEGPLCSTRSCTIERPYKCHDVCLPLSKVCDGVKDCFNGADEKSCSLSIYKGATSNSSHCVLWKKQPVTSNETTITDVEPGFLCRNGSCTPFTTLCDGVVNCLDGLDEIVCLQDTCSSPYACKHIRSSTCYPLPPQSSGGKFQSYCSCSPGFHPYVIGGRMVCVDVDECLTLSPCSQICSNSWGSYNCSCFPGWKLFNQSQCRSDPEYMLVELMTISGTPPRVNIYRSIESSPSYYNSMKISEHSALESNIFVDKITASTIHDSVYWSDSKHGAIYKCEKHHWYMWDEGTVTKLLQLPPDHRITGLAVDDIGLNLYWTDVGDCTVNVIKTREARQRRKRRSIYSKDYTVLLTKNNSLLCWPLDVATAPRTDLLFVSDGGDNVTRPSIHFFRISDSVHPRSKIVSSNIEWPISLAVDAVAKRLYWADWKLQRISSVNYDGSGRQTVFVFEKVRPTQISVFGDYIFGTDSFSRHGMFRIPKLSHVLSDRGSQPAELTWLVYRSGEPLALLILHTPYYHKKNLLSSCEWCVTRDSDGLCLPDHAGTYTCMCHNSGSRFESERTPCPCVGVSCSEKESCINGTCRCLDSTSSCDENDLLNSASTIASIVIATILILAVVIVIVLYRRRHGHVCLVNNCWKNVNFNPGSISYRDLVTRETDPILPTSSQLSLATTPILDSHMTNSNGLDNDTPVITNNGSSKGFNRVLYSRGDHSSSSSEVAQLLQEDQVYFPALNKIESNSSSDAE